MRHQIRVPCPCCRISYHRTSQSLWYQTYALSSSSMHTLCSVHKTRKVTRASGNCPAVGSATMIAILGWIWYGLRVWCTESAPVTLENSAGQVYHNYMGVFVITGFVGKEQLSAGDGAPVWVWREDWKCSDRQLSRYGGTLSKSRAIDFTFLWIILLDRSR